jgi:hypothetical protein
MRNGYARRLRRPRIVRMEEMLKLRAGEQAARPSPDRPRSRLSPAPPVEGTLSPGSSPIESTLSPGPHKRQDKN